MKLIIKIFLIFIFSLELFGRTREEVIKEAERYRDYEWTVGTNNILDLKTHKEGKSTEPEDKPDGIDDRMFKKVLDPVSKKWVWRKSTDNWPYVVGSNYKGVAFAYGGWLGKYVWGFETTNV